MSYEKTSNISLFLPQSFWDANLSPTDADWTRFPAAICTCFTVSAQLQGVSKGLLRAPPCEGQDLFMLLQEDPSSGRFDFFGCVRSHICRICRLTWRLSNRLERWWLISISTECSALLAENSLILFVRTRKSILE